MKNVQQKTTESTPKPKGTRPRMLITAKPTAADVTGTHDSEEGDVLSHLLDEVGALVEASLELEIHDADTSTKSTILYMTQRKIEAARLIYSQRETSSESDNDAGGVSEGAVQ